MSETVDARDAKHSPLTRSGARRPAHAGAAGPAGHVHPGGADRLERRVIDLDSVTDAVPAAGTAKNAVIGLPPVRDTSYWLG